MRLRINQFLALAGLTALETVRQPICLILAASCIVFIGVLPVLLTHTLGESERLVRDSALALHFVVGLLLGGYAACSTLTHEIRRGTAAAVLSKPVTREVFFLAKYAGVAAVMLLFSAAVTLATLLGVRMVHEPYVLDLWACGALLAGPVLAFAIGGFLNYALRRPFASSTFFLMVGLMALFTVGVSFVGPQGEHIAFGSMIEGQVALVSFAVALGILVLAAFAVALATRLDTVSTLSVCLVVFLLGLMSDYLLGRLADGGGVVAALYGLVPNWQHFWIVDALTTETPVPLRYLGTAAAYAASYLAAVLCLGLISFRHLEVKA